MPYSTFDDKIGMLEKYAEKKPAITLWEIISVFGHSAQYVLCCLLVIPFLQPIPLLGFSTVFGAIISFSGVLIFLGTKLFLPDFLKRYQLTQESCLKMCSGLRRTTDFLKRFLHPRGRFMQKQILVRRTTGLIIAFCGLLLALPLPFPGTNTIPSLAILCMCLGSIKEDGLAIFSGYLLTIVASLYIWYAITKPIHYFLSH